MTFTVTECQSKQRNNILTLKREKNTKYLLFVLFFIISHNQDKAWHYELCIMNSVKKKKKWEEGKIFPDCHSLKNYSHPTLVGLLLDIHLN